MSFQEPEILVWQYCLFHLMPKITGHKTYTNVVRFMLSMTCSCGNFKYNIYAKRKPT